MTSDEINEAIGYISGMIKHPAHNKLSEEAIGYLKSIISLAEEYLKVEGWPKEKEKRVTDRDYPNIKAEGFNEALRLCKFAAMKEKNKVSRKMIVSIIEDYFKGVEVETAKRQKAEINAKGLWGANCVSNTFNEIADGISTALLELINGKEA